MKKNKKTNGGYTSISFFIVKEKSQIFALQQG